MSYAAGTSTARPPGTEAEHMGRTRPEARPRRDPAVPVTAVFAGLATGADLLVSAGAARAVGGGNADRTLTAFLVLFVLGAAAAVYFGDRLIKRNFPQD